ncbi:MAG: amidohydrolase family protein, partial [Alphaproteobacteria bacterium]|nr:amidohydrolase family protein [Alphaproteobacteria bacterium]
EACAALAQRRGLPVYTHVLETKWQALEARLNYQRSGGSLVRYLDQVGLLGPHLNLVHAVWLRRDEIDLVAQRGGRIVQNPASNLKLKSGIAPFLDIRRAGIGVALGCDNTSAGDTQNMFQAMRLYALLAAVSDAELGRPLARETMQAATIGGAASAHLADELGAIRAGMKADLVVLDLDDPAFVPFNSAARQLVYSECGRAVETVIVDGRVVVRDRRLVTIDESELRERVAEVMDRYRRDLGVATQRNERFRPYLDAAYRRAWGEDVGI